MDRLVIQGEAAVHLLSAARSRHISPEEYLLQLMHAQDAIPVGPVDYLLQGRSIAEVNSQAMVFLDSYLRIVYANAPAFQMLPILKTVDFPVPLQDIDAGFYQDLEHRLRDPYTMRCDFLLNMPATLLSDQQVYALCSRIKTNDQHDVGILVSLLPAHSEREALAHTQSHAAILEINTKDLFLLVALDGRSLMVSPSFAQQLNYEPADLLQDNFEAFVHPNDRGRRIIPSDPQALTEPMVVGLRHRTGFHLVYELALLPVNNQEHQPLAFWIRLRNIESEVFETSVLLDQISDAVIMTDLDFRIKHWNSAAEAIYGLPADTVLGQRMGHIVQTRYHSGATDTVARQVLFETGQWQGEVEQRTDASDWHPIHSMVKLFRSKSGLTLGLVAVNRSLKHWYRSRQVLQRYADRLEVLRSIDHSVIAANSFDSIASTVLERLQTLIPAQLSRLLILDVHEHCLEFSLITSDDEPEPLFQVRSLEDVPDFSIWDESLLLADLMDASTKLPLFAVKKESRSLLLVPLRGRSGIMGILSFAADMPDVFSQEHLEVAEDIASQLPVVIEQQRLHEAERQQRIIAEMLRDTASQLTGELDFNIIIDRLLEQVLRLMPCEACSFMIVEGDELRMMSHLGFSDRMSGRKIDELRFGVDTPILGWRSVKDNRTVIVDDVRDSPDWVPLPGLEWVRSYVGQPITVGGEVVGLLNLNSEHAGIFRGASSTHLRILADQASIAFQNARLYNSLQQHVDELGALYRATASLIPGRDLQTMAQRIADAVAGEFVQSDCGVILVDGPDKPLRRFNRSGYRPARPVGQLHINSQGLVPAAIRGGDIIYAPDVSKESRYLAHDPATRSELVFPLRTASGVVGALDLQSHHLNAFDERDRRVLGAFADRAAVALENVMLYERLREYANQLESRVEERTAQLRESVHRIEAILNSASDAIVLASLDMVIEQTNPAFNALFGYETDELFGQSLDTLLVTGEHLFQEETAETSDALQAARRVERLTRSKDGSIFDVDVAVSVIRDPGHPGVICSFRDISERKQAEADLREALARETELSQLKSRFVSMVSHEFRTPLTTILTSSDLLRRYNTRLDDQKRDHHLQKIQTQVGRLTQLMDDILVISRAETVGMQFKPNDGDLLMLCQGLVQEMHALDPRHEIVFETELEECPMQFDESLLRLILNNLFSNAFKYSEPGSVVRLKLAAVADQACLTLSDQGIGIPEDDQRQIFGTFHRATNVGTVPGTGLGLAIVKMAVDAHGGTIILDSHEGIGSTFVVTLPRTPIS